jgi:hypothetical protein
MRILFKVVAMWLPMSSLAAQDTLQVTPGTRLRVTAVSSLLQLPPGSYRELTDTTVRSTGSLQDLTDTALRLAGGSSDLVIPRAAVIQLERSLGRRRSVTGGVLGFVLGGATGVALACVASRDSYGVPCEFQDSDAPFFLGIAAGGAVGAIVFASLLGREGWSVIRFDQLLPRP